MDSSTIAVTVNGGRRDIPQGQTLRGLIESMGLANAPCAAEINRVLVPRREHEARVLLPGDSIEIVSLVGGG